MIGDWVIGRRGDLAIAKSQSRRSPIAQSPMTEKCLDGRGAAGSEHPFETAGTLRLVSRAAVRCAERRPQFVLVENRVERTERMTEEAVLRVAPRRGRRGANVVGTLIVTDEDRTAGEVVETVRVRQRHHARAEAGEQGDCHTRTANPGLARNIDIQLSAEGTAASSGSRTAAMPLPAGHSGCTRATRVSEP